VAGQRTVTALNLLVSKSANFPPAKPDLAGEIDNDNVASAADRQNSNGARLLLIYVVGSLTVRTLRVIAWGNQPASLSKSFGRLTAFPSKQTAPTFNCRLYQRRYSPFLPAPANYDRTYTEEL